MTREGRHALVRKACLASLVMQIHRSSILLTFCKTISHAEASNIVVDALSIGSYDAITTCMKNKRVWGLTTRQSRAALRRQRM